MKKILASLLAITMLMTTMSACIIPASAEDAVAVATDNVIFNETFENYGSGNWLENLDTNGFVTSKITNMGTNTWKIYGSGHTTTTTEGETTTTTANGSVEVVDNPSATGKNTSAKVLKLDAGTISDGWFRIRRNANGNSYLDREDDLNGKMMVIKANFYLPTNYKSKSDTGSFMYDKWDESTRIWPNAGFSSTYGSTTWPIIGVGGGTYGSNAQTKVTQTMATGEWVEVKYVLDLSEYQTATHNADTYRGFYNGTVYSGQLGQNYKSYYTNTAVKYHRTVHHLYPQAATKNEAGDGVVLGEKFIDAWGGYNDNDEGTPSTFGDFYGVSYTLSGTTALTTDYLYMDNLTAYYIDKFVQSGDITYANVDEEGNWYKGEIRIPFSNNLSAAITENYSGTVNDYTVANGNYKNLFTLKDAEGNVVEGGIASASVDGNVLVITPAATIARDADYTIVADALFMDEEGQGLNQYSASTNLLTFTAGVDPYAHIIYDNGFEAYETGKDWYDYIDTTTGYVKTDVGVAEGEFSVHGSGSYTSTQSATVVNDPTNSNRGKVMALNIGTDATPYSNLRINANGKTGITRDSMGTGKKIVYEAKIFFPENFTGTEVAMFVNPGSDDQTHVNTVSGAGITSKGNGFYPITSGSWNYPMARTSRATGLQGTWHTIRHIVDVSEAVSKTHSDTTRALYDDQLQSAIFYNTGSGLAHTVNSKYPALAGSTKVVDFYDAKTNLFADGYETFGTFFGSHFNLRASSSTVSGNSTYYIDDLKAYWIDKLTFEAENVTDYQGGKIKLNFNQKIRETIDVYDKTAASESYLASDAKTLTLKDLFTIKDSDGNVVDGGIAAATLANDGKTVVLTPGSLEKNAEYTIVIDKFFIDEHGQGLNNNSTDYEIGLTVGEFVPFALETISQTAVSGFSQGRNVKITATFTTNVDDDSITNGIVVTGSEGNTVARNEGWTATFGTTEDGATDYKTVIFDFSNLPTDSYTVTTDADFLAANEGEFQDVLEITITAAAQPIELFNETFDTGYTADENWIKAANAVTDGSLYNGLPWSTATAYYKSYTVGNHDWDIQLHWTTTSGTVPSDDALNVTDFIGVVAAPSAATAKMSGNALKIYSNRGSNYAYDYVSFRRNFNKLNGIDFSSEAYKGKKLVYEADIYADSIAGDNSFFVPFAASSTKGVRDYADWMMLFSSGGLRAPGTYKNPFSSYGPIAMYAQVNTNSIGSVTTAPVNYKMVVSMGDNIDTLAYYVNGTLVQRSEANQAVLKGHEYNDSARHEFTPSDSDKALGENLNINDVIYGIWGLVGQGASTARTVYVDNFKAYLVDEFKVESVSGYGDVFNTAKGAVTYTFSKAVNANKAVANETIVLLDAEGNAVAGGIESVTLADGDYQMIVKLSETLPGNTKYTIKLTEGLQDVDGLPLSTEWKEYKYPIDDYYKGTDNVYSITDVAGSATLDCTYTPATTSTPAYLTYGSDHKVAVDTWVRDADAMKMYVNLTTSKATSLFADATATNESGVVTVNATFTNPETDVMPVWAVVAVYGEYNEMLGCTIANVTSINAGSTADDTITVNVGDSSKVKTVKLHVWNSYDAMVPYHKAETLISK